MVGNMGFWPTKFTCIGLDRIQIEGTHESIPVAKIREETWFSSPKEYEVWDTCDMNLWTFENGIQCKFPINEAIRMYEINLLNKSHLEETLKEIARAKESRKC